MSESLRQDQANCSLTVDGREMSNFEFNKRDGGEISSEGSKTFPAGGRTQRAHGGPVTVENVTLTGEMIPERDLADIKFLESRVGKGECSVVENILDANGAVIGRSDSWTGKLGRVSTGSYDANSSDPREFEIEIETHGGKG